MQLGLAMELKEQLIAENYAEIGSHAAGIRAQSLPVGHIFNKQLSVGFSRRSKNDYHVEVRAKQQGRGLFAAQQLRERYNEIHVGFIKEVRAYQTARDPDPRARYRAIKRPLEIGLSISPPEGGMGTLGGFVATADGKR